LESYSLVSDGYILATANLAVVGYKLLSLVLCLSVHTQVSPD